MEFQNAINKTSFLQSCEKGLYSIESLENKENGTKVYQLNDNTLNDLSWILHKCEKHYVIEYKGEPPFKHGFEPYMLTIEVNEDKVKLTELHRNGKNYKSEKYLKKYLNIGLFASCFIKFGLCD